MDNLAPDTVALAAALEGEGMAPDLAADLALGHAANVPGALAAYREAKSRGAASLALLVWGVRNGLTPSGSSAPRPHYGGAYEPAKVAPVPAAAPASDAKGRTAAMRRGARIAAVWPWLASDAKAALLAARYQSDGAWAAALQAAMPALKAAGALQRRAGAPDKGGAGLVAAAVGGAQ